MENYFYKKYEPIDWKKDGRVILNKIGKNLTSRFDSMSYEIIEEPSSYSDRPDELRIEITQGKNICPLYWSFNQDDLVARVENSDGDPIQDMSEVERELKMYDIIKESNMKNLKGFRGWKK
jgi:hypothetical protein